jgi:hypothetical protein
MKSKQMYEQVLSTKDEKFCYYLRNYLGEGKDARQMLAPEQLTAIRVAAAGRVVDIRSIYDSMYDVVDKIIVDCINDDDDGGLMITADKLPLTSPPVMGMSGWWQIHDDMAVLIERHELVAKPEKYVEQWRLTWIGDIQDNGFILMPVAGYIGIQDTNGFAAAIKDVRVHFKDGWHDDIHKVLARDIIVVACMVLLANSIAVSDPKVVETRHTPPKLVKAAAKRGRSKTKSVTSINLPGLTYRKGVWRSTRMDSNGVVWHTVRGHPRTFKSEKFANMRGRTIWIKPHDRGDKNKGISTRPYKIEGGQK